MSTESLNYENDVYVVSDNGNKYVFNSDSYHQNKTFTMGNGTYIFKNIPSGHPMAILNNGLTDKITYTGENLADRLYVGQGSRTGEYDFYYGHITVTVRDNSVTDNFGNLSIYCFNHGYMGGQNLLQYETHPYIDSNDVITFIYTDFGSATEQKSDNYPGDVNIKTRYEYWDQNETFDEGQGHGLLPNNGISITLLTSSPWMITNPPILQDNNYLEFEDWVNSKSGNENKPFNLTKSNFKQYVFDKLIDQNFFSGGNIIFNDFQKHLKRIRINSKYVLKLHGSVLEFDDSSSVQFQYPISIDYYDPLDQNTNGPQGMDPDNDVYFQSSKTGLKNKDIIEYLDLGKLRKFNYKDPTTIDEVYGSNGEMLQDYRNNDYEDIREKMGGIKTKTGVENDFYIRFGEPTAPNGSVAVNCFVAGTMIKTDQGEIPIEKVSRKNTIDGFKVYCVLSSLLKDKNDYYVLVKKDAFGKNRPNKDIISTKWHGIYIKDEDTEFVRIKDIVDGKNIIKKSVVEPIRFYNICLKDVHHYMYANNLKVETLLPTQTILPVYGN